MSTFTIDGDKVESQESFWAAYLHTVKPEGAIYFGRNPAAFRDALNGGPGWPGDDFVLRVIASDKMRAQLGGEFMSQLCEIFKESHNATIMLE